MPHLAWRIFHAGLQREIVLEFRYTELRRIWARHRQFIGLPDIKFGLNILLRFQTRATQKATAVENRHHISDFSTPRKI